MYKREMIDRDFEVFFEKVEAQLATHNALKKYPDLSQRLKTCYLNTYETTLQQDDQGTFVITGDIPAMWLRDSVAQIKPYLLLASKSEAVKEMIFQVIQRQWHYILLDPYANAFNRTADGKGHQNDKTDMSPWVWERKYEIDSLAYVMQLTYFYWKNTQDQRILGGSLQMVMQAIVSLWQREQRHDQLSPYRFERSDCRQSDTLHRGGLGGESVYTGMTWSGFRPSDDACIYGYLVPANMFAVVVLGYMREMSEAMFDYGFARDIALLEMQIRHGIETYGRYEHPIYGTIYAYETDGNGRFNLMDDANVPSLLAMPYLGYCDFDDPTYLNTRRFILSRDNPYFYEGNGACGIGSPHTPDHYIWHIGLAMQGLTSCDDQERERILDWLMHTDGGTGLMHEGFHADDPNRYTREWFSWANAMFSEFVLDLIGIGVDHSALVKKQKRKG